MPASQMPSVHAVSSTVYDSLQSSDPSIASAAFQQLCLHFLEAPFEYNELNRPFLSVLSHVLKSDHPCFDLALKTLKTIISQPSLLKKRFFNHHSHILRCLYPFLQDFDHPHFELALGILCHALQVPTVTALFFSDCGVLILSSLVRGSIERSDLPICRQAAICVQSFVLFVSNLDAVVIRELFELCVLVFASTDDAVCIEPLLNGVSVLLRRTHKNHFLAIEFRIPAFLGPFLRQAALAAAALKVTMQLLASGALSDAEFDISPVLDLLRRPFTDSVLELALSCLRFFVAARPAAVPGLLHAGVAQWLSAIVEDASFEQIGRCISAIRTLVVAGGEPACAAFYNESVVRGLAEFVIAEDVKVPERFYDAVDVLARLADFEAATAGGIGIVAVLVDAGADVALYAVPGNVHAASFCAAYLDRRS
jgi:hypothetical protein